LRLLCLLNLNTFSLSRMEDKKVIFIGGSSYSGSTLLDMMIASGKDGFSAGEVSALFFPYRTHHVNPECGCGRTDCSLWKEIKPLGPENVYKEIFTRFPEISHIVDSSKDPLWIRDQAKRLKKQRVEVKHVLIWKTSLEFAMSRYKRNRIVGWDTAWKNYYRHYFSQVENWISVKYSDLAQSPQRTLSGLCQEIGIDYFDGKELYWEYCHHTLFGNASARIHIYSKETGDYKKLSEQLRESNQSDPESRHRTIYYDTNTKRQLPRHVIDTASQDPEINLIEELLQATAPSKIHNRKKINQLYIRLRFPAYLLALRKGLATWKRVFNKMRFR